ncbi:hypothetical protein [Thermosipho sp. 1074]|nr:hypothetical protein [Thermosipho sp. 1074]
MRILIAVIIWAVLFLFNWAMLKVSHETDLEMEEFLKKQKASKKD